VKRGWRETSIVLGLIVFFKNHIITKYITRYGNLYLIFWPKKTYSLGLIKVFAISFIFSKNSSSLETVKNKMKYEK